MEKQQTLISNGGVAQLGEHLPCKQGVMGSNPIISTKQAKGLQCGIRNAECRMKEAKNLSVKRIHTNHIGS